MIGSFYNISQATRIIIKQYYINYFNINCDILTSFFVFKVGLDILLYGTRYNRGFGKEREWNKLVEEKQSVAEHANIVKNYFKYFS